MPIPFVITVFALTINIVFEILLIHQYFYQPKGNLSQLPYFNYIIILLYLQIVHLFLYRQNISSNNNKLITRRKMRIISMHVLKWEEEKSLFICSAYELGFVSWYQRPFLKETVNFGARTSTNRSKVGERVAIHLPDAQALCYVYVANNKIAYAVLADDQYPERIVHLILRKMHLEFNKDFEVAKFSDMKQDESVKWEKLQLWIKQFQQPKQVDKLQKLKSELEEVEKIVHKNMDDLLKRDEDLNKLMAKSQDVSKMSLDFYNTAKKTNKRCCSLY